MNHVQHITLEGDDGSSHACNVVHAFNFEGHDYVLLLKTSIDDGEETLVVLRQKDRGDETTFQVIQNDEEFEAVVSFVEELARQAASPES